ncbi:SusC/RagA family TonB-linked outer membrane protein [Pedobacter antarcticus]|uniref:SusC/RagA family TonB-linked outer membrane protein n=1 Tax=Pedobacter antarcticus TaxID=34086 RepID=UPI0008849E0A|nr:SusC/RagA family TonB-linked outer membrane protein [Pedobacter antarcticus]SDM31041.1 TonB-linked outer membrane protein, SusC/RagA family [Pedobacter antarcticus]
MKRVLLVFMVLFTCYSVADAQTKKITGTVIGQDDNQPIPGASIKVEGSTAGTVTDGKGNFSLQVPQNSTLVISFIGYSNKTIKVTGDSNYKILLGEDSKKLEEVVVTSFGIARDKKTLGYGVSKVSGESLTKSPTPDITNALAGKVAGVQISGSGGGFTSSNVTIRGFSSITRSNQPLYVIDGVPIDNGGGANTVNAGVASSSRASDVNPEDIESINVLKGAAATVLYGSRAASGVILITTKKGKKGGRSQVSFTSNTTIGVINRFPEYQNEYAQGSQGIYGSADKPNDWVARATSWGPRIAGQKVKNILGEEVALQAYPNNVRDILQSSAAFDNNINFSGADEKYDYRVSYGNNTQDALVPGNKLYKNTFSVNLGGKITEKFKINTSFSYINNRSNRTQAGNQGANPLWRAIYAPRSYDVTGLPVTDAAGNQVWYSSSEENPYWAIDHVTTKQELNRFYGNLNLKYDFTSWLAADLKVGADVYTNSFVGFDDKGVRSNGNTSSAGAGGVIETNDLTRNLSSYFTLTANKTYGDFNLSATVGNEVLSNYYKYSAATGRSITLPGFSNLKNFTTFNAEGRYEQIRSMGVFGDVSVGYKSYLNLNLKARNDFSSTLVKEYRSIFYPAIALSFVPTEAFPELKSNFLTSAKIRANVGEVGKSAGVYQTGTYYVTAGASDGFSSTAVNFPYNGLAGYTYSNAAGNAAINPEFTREIELGTELAFFNNRLSLDFSVYKRDSRNLIFGVPVPPSSGFTSQVKNAGKLSTKGLEFLLAGTAVKTNNFTWDASLNFTTFRSVVKELAPGVTMISLGGFTSPNVQAVAGQQYGLIYSNMYLRDDQGRMVIKANGLPQATAAVGQVGNPNPKFTAGLSNSFTYKDFNFSFLLDFKYKGDILSRTVGDLRINGVAKETAEFDRFNADGTVSKPYLFEGVHADGTPNTTNVSAQDYWGLSGKYVAWEGYVLDATYLKLREATFSYNLPSKLLERTKFISRLQISIYGRNLLTYAPHFPHLDPEQNVLGVSNARGLEFGIQPVARTFGATIRATF